LLSLESEAIRARGGAQDVAAAQDEIREAIAGVRAAIAQLRTLPEVETSVTELGFVLDDPTAQRPPSDVQTVERSMGAPTYSVRGPGLT
jgi:hypothetical protein